MDQSGRAVVNIQRTNQRVNRLRAISIYVDGLKVGTVLNGGSLLTEVTPGQHELFAKIDWQRTDDVQVSLGPGDRIELVCGSDLTGWKILLAGVVALLPRCWIYLRSSGPHHAAPR